MSTMSIRKLAAVTLLLAGLAACAATSDSGTGGTGNNTGSGIHTDGGYHANSYGYGDRYYQLGRD
jgi:hypothetical protein